MKKDGFSWSRVFLASGVTILLLHLIPAFRNFIWKPAAATSSMAAARVPTDAQEVAAGKDFGQFTVTSETIAAVLERGLTDKDLEYGFDEAERAVMGNNPAFVDAVLTSHADFADILPESAWTDERANQFARDEPGLYGVIPSQYQCWCSLKGAVDDGLASFAGVRPDLITPPLLQEVLKNADGCECGVDISRDIIARAPSSFLTRRVIIRAVALDPMALCAIPDDRKQLVSWSTALDAVRRKNKAFDCVPKALLMQHAPGTALQQ